MGALVERSPQSGIFEQTRIQPRVAEAIRPQSELQSLIIHLDQDWEAEGLPQDWYSFGKAGFSMRAQMNLLHDLDLETRRVWADRTEQDIRGFTVEYLKQDLVHPSFYRKIRTEDGRVVLIDEKYGKPLTDMVLSEERDGSVKLALGEIQDHSGGGGSAILTSPKGWTDLYTDRGIPIVYPDSWFFGFIDLGERVVGIGIRTDFSLSECRDAIVKLTGEDLPKDASIEDYVRAIAKISPGQGVSTPGDLVRVLREVRPGPYVYKDRTWDEVEERATNLEELYSLELAAEEYIRQFKEFAKENGDSKFELQKALAATLLRLSELYLDKERQTRSGEEYRVLGNVIYPQRFQQDHVYGPTYGQVLSEIEKIPGCAGGGSESESITSIIDRMGIAGSGLGLKLPEDKYGAREVYCKACGKYSTRPKGKLLSRCQNKLCPDPTYIACKPSKPKAA